MNLDIENLFKIADESHACFITVSVLDPTKRVDNLTHHTLNKRFPTEEISNSLDACLNSVNILRKRRKFLRGT